MTKTKTKRRAFTAKNIIAALVEVTGLSPDHFSVEVDELDDDKSGTCSLVIQDPASGKVILEDVRLHRDQKSLDLYSEEHLPFDETYGFFDVGKLSNEDIVRHSAKGCNLAELKHWIIATGRECGQTEAQIAHNLRHPVEAVINLHKTGDVVDDGACLTLISQCRPNRMNILKMAKHLLKAAGGAQKVWSAEFFMTLPGGFLVHIITDEEAEIFRKLLTKSKGK